jgi:starch phosphorylase
LWELRFKARQALVEYARKRPSRQRMQGASSQQIAEAESILNPGSLTIGFARRPAAYKHRNFLLHDADRLVRILTNRQCPVQLILAGKAHPQDYSGQAMIKQ